MDLYFDRYRAALRQASDGDDRRAFEGICITMGNACGTQLTPTEYEELSAFAEILRGEHSWCQEAGWGELTQSNYQKGAFVMHQIKKRALLALIAVCSILLGACSKGGAIESTTTWWADLEAAFQQISASASDSADAGTYVIPAAEDFAWKGTDGGVVILSYSGSATAIEIPVELGGKPVVAIGDKAFCQLKLTGVRLPDTVEKIGDSAFFYCTELIEVIFGESVKEIGTDAFHGCISLTTVKLNEGLEVIGKRAFEMTTSLTYIDFPRTLTTIQEAAFGMSGLKGVTIPGNVSTICKRAFIGCASLETVVVEDGVESIEVSAFQLCQSLTRAFLTDTVTSIGQNAFSECPDLIICAPAGTAASDYAEANGITFQGGGGTT